MANTGILQKGIDHLIENRASAASLTQMVFNTYNQGTDLRLEVRLRTGVKVVIRITRFDYRGPADIGFVGEIANDNNLVKVTGIFTNKWGGSFRLND